MYCILFNRVTFDNMADSCQLITHAAMTALTGSNFPTRVATFGDVTVEEVGDWLRIILDEPSSTVRCTSLHILMYNVIVKVWKVFAYA